ncbi:hypothetical protein ADT71_14040 [Novosphingobium sp. ST904]|nr:hypothetical protein ADT71_14040 [Novosphingobium sp. ST904]
MVADFSAVRTFDQLLFGMDLFLAAMRAGKDHGSHRLEFAAAFGPGNAADRDRHVGIAVRDRPLRHRPCRSRRNRAKRVDDIRRDPQHLLLRFVRIGHESAVEHGGGAGHFGQRGADEATRTALGQRDLAADRLVFGDHAHGKVVKVLRE